jgi:hypothetical protein
MVYTSLGIGEVQGVELDQPLQFESEQRRDGSVKRN